MDSMAMTPQQYSEFQRMKKDVEELREMRREVAELKGNWEELNTKIDKILSLVKGIAIGVAIGAVIFGLLSVKDFISLVK